MDIEPTFKGYIEDEKDVILILQAILDGKLKHVPRRPYEIERPYLIISGNIFVFIEEISGIKRWTDGISWSPSRISGKFLIYKEIDNSSTSSTSSTSSSSTTPTSKNKNKSGSRIKLPPLVNSNNSSVNNGNNSPSNTINGNINSNLNVLDQELPPTPNMSSVSTNGTSLRSLHPINYTGLIKKTISVNFRRPTNNYHENFHIISYYTIEDIKQNRLITPKDSLLFRNIKPLQSLVVAMENTSLGNAKSHNQNTQNTQNNSNENNSAYGNGNNNINNSTQPYSNINMSMTNNLNSNINYSNNRIGMTRGIVNQDEYNSHSMNSNNNMMHGYQIQPTPNSSVNNYPYQITNQFMNSDFNASPINTNTYPYQYYASYQPAPQHNNNDHGLAQMYYSNSNTDLSNNSPHINAQNNSTNNANSYFSNYQQNTNPPYYSSNNANNANGNNMNGGFMYPRQQNIANGNNNSNNNNNNNNNTTTEINVRNSQQQQHASSYPYINQQMHMAATSNYNSIPPGQQIPSIYSYQQQQQQSQQLQQPQQSQQSQQPQQLQNRIPQYHNGQYSSLNSFSGYGFSNSHTNPNQALGFGRIVDGADANTAGSSTSTVNINNANSNSNHDNSSHSSISNPVTKNHQ